MSTTNQSNNMSNTKRNYKRNKSQMMPNATNLQNSGVIGNLNNYNRRHSLNLNMNMRQGPNGSNAIYIENNA